MYASQPGELPTLGMLCIGTAGKIAKQNTFALHTRWLVSQQTVL